MSTARFEQLAGMLGDCSDVDETELRELARRIVGAIAQRRGAPYGVRAAAGEVTTSDDAA
jgi:hypothetical protein